MTITIGFTVDFIPVVVQLWSSPASQPASRDSHRGRLQVWSDVFRRGRSV